MKITDATVRVYLDSRYLKTGILWHYFYEEPTSDELTVMFRCNNCGFDDKANFFIFELTRLHSEVVEDVYIPREFIRGISVLRDTEDDDSHKVGFIKELKQQQA
jgi:hypothetical protein